MFLQVVITEKDTQTISYPCLMRHIDSSFIVMFDEPGQGVVVASPNGFLYPGWFCDTFDMKLFEKFSGRIDYLV